MEVAQRRSIALEKLSSWDLRWDGTHMRAERRVHKPTAQPTLLTANPVLIKSTELATMSQVHQPPEEPDTRLEGLDTRLSYRVGWPALPALPVQTFPLAIDFSSHLNEIEQILEKNDVHIVAFEFGKRENVGAEVQSGQSTITIRANFEPSSAQSWIEAVISIRTYLSGVGVDHAIEIIDNHAYHGLRSFPLNPSEISLAESWSNVILPTIEGLIDHHQWIAIDLLNREYPSLSEPQPTIVISARDANDPTWHDHTVPSLNQYLHSIHCAQLYIEILYLEDVLAATKPDVEALGMTYFDAVYPGASCGKAGSKSSGTLGGKLILEKQGNRFEVGLTNHHVIFGDEIIQCKGFCLNVLYMLLTQYYRV